MPKYRPETAKAKAKLLLKPLLRNRLNHSATARELGVSQATIQEKFHNSVVQETLAEYLQKHFKHNYIKKKFKEGLEANKKVPDEFVEVPDLHCRHKYLVTLLECQGHLKHSNGNGKNISVINIIHAYRQEKDV